LATKKTKGNYNFKKAVPKAEVVHNEVYGFVLFVFDILFFLAVYFQNSVGKFGEVVAGVTRGLFGEVGAYISVVLLLWLALLLILNKNYGRHLRLFIQTTILVILLSVFFGISNYLNIKSNESSFLTIVNIFFTGGMKHLSGGVIGGVISMPFVYIFGQLGANIIVISMFVLDLVILTDFSIKEFVFGMYSKVKKNRVYEEVYGKPEIPFHIPMSIDDDYGFNYKLGQENVKKGKTSFNSKADNFKVDNFVKKDSNIKDLNDINFINSDEKLRQPSQVSKNKNNVVESEFSVIDKPETVYHMPSYNLLNTNDSISKDVKGVRAKALEEAKKLENTLLSFGVEAKVMNISKGPAVTRFELQPGPGVKVSKIVNLSDDIALNMASAGVRIEAPIPGKAAVGIEIANKETTPVLIREVLETPEFKNASSKLTVALGKDISGEIVLADIGKMPHLLIAGATGSGKSVCINTLIISLIYKASPDEVKLLMVDPKVVELGIYNGIPHLFAPVVTDPKKAANLLNWAVSEMETRYKLFAERGVRDLKGYNSTINKDDDEKKLPSIVIIIDELADLMMVAPGEVEDKICRLAQMARAAGMHLIVATQRPSVDVITGLIKANIPSRLSFSVSSQVDSRTILDGAGAEKLLGKGDMLFYPVGMSKPLRVQGAFISDKEVERVVDFIKTEAYEYNDDVIEKINADNISSKDDNADDKDELLAQAIEFVIESGHASTSMIQRRFKVGYSRAGRIIDQMYSRGVIGPYAGSKPREVVISRIGWQEMQTNSFD
jgi:S-DNA-T family DNA segregation ATPase FtsK/SpoIIIE